MEKLSVAKPTGLSEYPIWPGIPQTTLKSVFFQNLQLWVRVKAITEPQLLAQIPQPLTTAFDTLKCTRALPHGNTSANTDPILGTPPIMIPDRNSRRGWHTEAAFCLGAVAEEQVKAI